MNILAQEKVARLERMRKKREEIVCVAATKIPPITNEDHPIYRRGGAITKDRESMAHRRWNRVVYSHEEGGESEEACAWGELE
jgi:hypothetical protein